MKRYVWKRLSQVVPTTLGILLLAFLTFHVIGDSPAAVALGQRATPAALADFEARHGYDRPLFFGAWHGVYAVSDGRVPAAAATDSGPRVRPLPLFYPLPAGRYRWRFEWAPGTRPPGDIRMHWTLHEPGGRTETRQAPLQRMRGGRMEVRLRVANGATADRFTLREPVAAPLPQSQQLRRATRHRFDSQFFRFVQDLGRGDLGLSVSHNRPVADVLRAGARASLALTLPIFAGGLLAGIPLGMLCAAWRGRMPDRLILWGCAVLMSVNYVVWVIGAQYVLAFRLRWFSIWGFESWHDLVLPVAIGVVSGLGRDVRLYRTVILDEVYRPHVRAAMARGLHPVRVWGGHILRNSLVGIITQISLVLPFLFMGSLLLESFYGIPGLGGVSLNAIHSGDVSVVRAVVILGALLYQGVNLLTDLLYAALDPRVRIR